MNGRIRKLEKWADPKKGDPLIVIERDGEYTTQDGKPILPAQLATMKPEPIILRIAHDEDVEK